MLQATDKGEIVGDAGQEEDAHCERSRRFPFDRSLLTALVDRWRPETHTFHLPFGEMTVTLQDVAMLTGLPIAGAALGPNIPPMGWQDDILGRFANILPEEPEGGYFQFPVNQTHGPRLIWLTQFRVSVWSLFRSTIHGLQLLNVCLDASGEDGCRTD